MKLRIFDSLKFVRAMFVALVAAFAFAPAHAATLPAGYTELEYLERNTTTLQPYIDTGLNFNSNYIYEINFLQSDARNAIMGALIEAYNKKGTFLLTYCNDSTCFYSSTSSASVASRSLSLPDNVRHTAKYQQSTKTALLDDINVWSNSWITDENIPYNIFLFAGNIAGNVRGTRQGYLRIYSYRVKDADGVLIQNFVPAKNSSGVVGMYDLMDSNPETAFHTNAGTGEFIAGEYQIKIATTKYNEQQFAPVETDLDTARTVINNLITQMQTNAVNVSKLAVEKQTRPNATCPAGKNCLLVTDPNGAENWYEIVGANAVQSSSNVPDYFSFTTTALNAGDTVGFSLSPSGTFTVDWGDGSAPQVIERTNTTSETYSHSYANAGSKTIKITGRATGYSTDQYAGVFSFGNTSQIASIDGCLGAIFPTLGNGAGQQPKFSGAFANTQITSIPENLFSGVTGAAGYMFAGTFYNAPITSIPAGLFRGITGAADHMFTGTFSSTQITSIPAGLFRGITGAEEGMFSGTFAGCSNLTGYIPESIFAGLIQNNSPDASGFMSGIFSGASGLATTCPQNMTEVSTPYKSAYWGTSNGNYAVMCRPN